MSFLNLLGDSEVCRQLTALANNRRLPHAVVLESRDGKLARDLSAEIAAAFLCSAESGGIPCGKCSNCKKVRAGVHPDVYTVVTSGGKQSTGVGEIREMIGDCYIKPNEARGKVYYIFDKMTPEAQNALLKILEEPPQNVMFIITAEKSTLLLKTVLSRSTLFKITGEDDRISDEADSIAIEIVQAAVQNIELPLIGATSKLIKSRDLTKQTLDRLGELFTMLLEVKFMGESGYPDYIVSAARLLRRSSIVKLTDVVAQAQEMLSHNCNMNVLATWLCANIRESRH